MDNIMIALQDIRKIYHIGSQDFAALAGITLQIKEGEFAALMGPSGSGKSTLMNILGCLDRPTSGSYKLGGKEVAHLSDDELAVTRNKSIGFVFQAFHLMPHRSVADNIALAGLYQGVPAEERKEASRRAIDLVGLDHRSDSPAGLLSGGERQRVAIARAMAVNPAILLCDEPTGNLDSINSEAIIDLLTTLNGAGTTVVIITHNPEIAGIGNLRLRLHDGVVTRDAA